ncbi:MAG TPA: hypothetical protein ENH91_00275 [Leeuwenhoekiella sp.]|nr:hypothetical protein [Leeuwenhoekiella sp.]
MNFLKLVFYILVAKHAFIVLGLICGAIIYFFSGSYVYSMLGCSLLCVYFYWNLFGPISLAVKRSIVKLKKRDLAIDTYCLFFSNEAKDFGILKDNWFHGYGYIDHFTSLYKTQIVKEGVAFYPSSNPYFHVYIIPWSSIRAVSENRDFCAERKVNPEETLEISFKDSERIFLPISSDMLKVINESLNK